jgi:hypothetical protein
MNLNCDNIYQNQQYSKAVGNDRFMKHTHEDNSLQFLHRFKGKMAVRHMKNKLLSKKIRD